MAASLKMLMVLLLIATSMASNETCPAGASCPIPADPEEVDGNLHLLQTSVFVQPGQLAAEAHGHDLRESHSSNHTATGAGRILLSKRIPNPLEFSLKLPDSASRTLYTGEGPGTGFGFQDLMCSTKQFSMELKADFQAKFKLDTKKCTLMAFSEGSVKLYAKGFCRVGYGYFSHDFNHETDVTLMESPAIDVKSGRIILKQCKESLCVWIKFQNDAILPSLIQEAVVNNDSAAHVKALDAWGHHTASATPSASSSVSLLATKRTDNLHQEAVVKKSSAPGSVTGTSTYSAGVEFTEGVRQFRNRHYKFTGVPKYLLGTTLFQGPCKHYKDDVIKIQPNPGNSVTVYVLVSVGNGGDVIEAMEKLLSSGWAEENSPMESSSYSGKTFKVFSKTTSSTISLTLTPRKVELSIAIRQAPYRKIFDGECDGPEVMVYSGSDNPGTTELARVNNCATACTVKKTALSGSWDGFVAKGFITMLSGTSQGRCWCESSDSATCSRIQNAGYVRYDFQVDPAVKNQEAASSCIDKLKNGWTISVRASVEEDSHVGTVMSHIPLVGAFSPDSDWVQVASNVPIPMLVALT